MLKRESYHTKQKELLFLTVQSISHEFTIKELYDLLGGSVGLTTIYRFMDKLVLDKKVSKRMGLDNKPYYQYLEECNCPNHFFLKCDMCGKMIHVDCDCIEFLFSHISQSHQFIPNHENTIIRGICNTCQKG